MGGNSRIALVILELHPKIPGGNWSEKKLFRYLPKFGRQ